MQAFASSPEEHAGMGTAAASWGPIARKVLGEAGPDYFIAAPCDVLVTKVSG